MTEPVPTEALPVPAWRYYLSFRPVSEECLSCRLCVEMWLEREGGISKVARSSVEGIEWVV